MGQAKKRGSFEERKSLSIERHKKEEDERKLRLLEVERNKTPEERKIKQISKLKTRELLNIMYGAYLSNLFNKK